MNLTFFVSDLKKIGIYILICSLFAPLFSQQQQSIYKLADIAKVMNRAEKELGNNEWELSESDYLIMGDSMIIVPTGRHYVFLYTHKSDSFKRLDKSKYHGHNFGRKLILHNGEIYAFGGYGFWKSHSKLIRFDLKSGEWNIVQLKGDVISGMPQLINHSGDSITIYGTAVTNQELGEKYWTREIYILDLNTFTVVK